MTPLAAGGMAEIWLARQASTGHTFERFVVIKRMARALEDDPHHVEMFRTEARIAAALHHPNVVEVFELGIDRGSFFIAMEFINGETLAEVWKEGLRVDKPISGPIAAQLVAWSAEGLHYAHTKTGDDGRPMGLVHRDVSPQNLLVTYEGSVKLVDFGIAKVSSGAISDGGSVKGKLGYMSPEQGRGEPLDARTDVFSLGVVLFELVTRTRLFPKLPDLEVLTLIANNAPLPKAQERRRDVPDALDRIISKAMAPNREHRFATAKEVQLALLEFLAKTGRPTGSADVAEAMRTLFAERLAQRKELVELAKRGDLTATQVPVRMFPAEPVAVAEPPPSIEVVRAPPIAPKPSPRRRLVPLVAAVIVAALGTATWWATRGPVDQPTMIIDAGPSLSHTIIEVDSRPSGAQVQVDGHPQGVTPVVLSVLEVGTHDLQVSKVGHRSQTRVLSIKPEADRLSLVVDLEPEGQEDSPAMGRLTLVTKPRTTVYLGTRKLGVTPLVNVPLPAGRQLLRLVSPDLRQNSSIEVIISSNQTTVKRLSLQ